MLDGAGALAWRWRRHALQTPEATSAVDVAQRVIALRGWPAEMAELAVCVRLAQPDPGDLQRSLEAGDLIRSYAFRGGSYVFTPDVAAVLLTVRTTTQVHLTARYQQQGGFAIEDWEPLRHAVREALAPGPLTRAEIADRLAAIPGLRHLAPAAATGAGSDALYKPLHWWGDICFGPTRDGQSTFRLLDGDPRWPGSPDLDDAGRQAILHYLKAYAPATWPNLHYWLGEGLSVPRRRLLGWLDDLGGDVTLVTVDGLDAYVLTADLDAMSSAQPTDVVRLLPAFDPWVNGPGTADPRVIAPARRGLASRGSNLMVRAGVVTGTWRLRGRTIVVSWFEEAGPPPREPIEAEVQRLAAVRGEELGMAWEPAWAGSATE